MIQWKEWNEDCARCLLDRLNGKNMKKHWFSIKFYNLCYKIKLGLFKTYYHIRNTMRLNSTGVEYNSDIVVTGKIIISNCGNMKMGKNVVINSGYYPNPVGTSVSRLYTHNANSELTIGDNVGMSNVLIFAKERIVIDDGAMIGAETMIIDCDFHGIDVCTDEMGNVTRDVGKAEQVYIGKNTFIGARSIILKGVSIGARSVIGAGSVVTKSIPEDELWAGNPAVFVRKLKGE